MKALGPIAWWLLLGVTMVQWVLISYLLQERHSQNIVGDSSRSSSSSLTNPLAPTARDSLDEAAKKKDEEARTASPSDKKKKAPSGVAAAIFFSNPAWFHRRYPVLLQNVLANIPNDWAIQLFVHPTFWKTRVLPIHPGLTRLLEEHRNRIFVVELPPEFQGIKQPNQRIPLESWFWKTLVADRVLLFSGNGMLCTHGHTQEHWDALMQLDYIGVPSRKNGGQGGDGSTHSYRNRTVMLQALDYAKEHNIVPKLPEYTFFIDTMQKLQHEAPATTIRLATPQDTIWFGGVQTTNSSVKGHKRPIPPPPMVVSGTQAKLSFQERDDLLLVCPELKTIFPSLHEPACFGAHPDPVACKATICALQDKLPESGC